MKTVILAILTLVLGTLILALVAKFNQDAIEAILVMLRVK